MNFRVSRPEVLDNLVRFKDSLAELRDRQQKEQDRGQEEEKSRKYKVLLNRKTGDMQFARKIANLEEEIVKREKTSSLDDFQEVHLVVGKKGGGSSDFSIQELDGSPLNAQIDPVAVKVAEETVRVLNLKAKSVKKGRKLLEEEVLKDLSSVEVAPVGFSIDELPGWGGNLSRLEAEKKLESTPVGTYILREGDEITFSTTFHLYQENHTFVHPYILTVVELEDKISDYLLLKTDRGWCFYSDDPNLEDRDLYHYVSTPKELLKKCSSLARTPYQFR